MFDFSKNIKNRTEMIPCCVLGCTLFNNQITMHKFPIKDPDRCKRWLEAIGRPDLEIPPHKKCCYYVCKNHFEPHNYFPTYTNRNKLKCTAVPDCNLPNIGESSIIKVPSTQNFLEKAFRKGDEDENVPLSKLLETKNVNYTCVLCKKGGIAMSENNCYDMEKTIMKSGETMKDFIRKQVFDENMKISDFENNCSCQSCHNILRELDKYLWKCKMIKKIITDTHYQSTEKNVMGKSLEPTISIKMKVIKDKTSESHISVEQSSENMTTQYDDPKLLNKKNNEIEEQQYQQYDSATLQILQENIAVSSKMTTKKNHYQCSKCTKTFSRSQDVKRHEVVHTGEMRFSCSACNKMFLYAASLRAHILQKHTAQRKFTCELCNLRFPFKHHLQRHVRSHDRKKQFKCPECETTFIEKYNLLVHMRNHMVRKNSIKKPR